jgi:hypothetical protein
MQVANLDYSDYLGRVALGRVLRGSARTGDPIVRVARDGREVRGRLTKVYTHFGLQRVEVESVVAGDIVAVSGLDEVQIGDTLCDPARVEPLPFAGRRRADRRRDLLAQHQPVRRPRGQVRDEPPHRRPPAARAADQRRAAGRGARRRGVPRRRPRRAAPVDPDRGDAARGLRVLRVAARGHRQDDRRRALRAVREGRRRRADRRDGRGHGVAVLAPRPTRRPRAGRGARAPDLLDPGARPVRLPQRVPVDDGRRGPAEPRLRRLRAPRGRAADARQRLAGGDGAGRGVRLQHLEAAGPRAPSSSTPAPRSTWA